MKKDKYIFVMVPLFLLYVYVQYIWICFYIYSKMYAYLLLFPSVILSMYVNKIGSPNMSLCGNQ